MTTFKLTLEMNNAAFVDAGEANELARILREVADRIEGGGVPCEPIRLRDYNGNTVGSAEHIIDQGED